MSPELRCVTIQAEPEKDPDLSYLGTYQDVPDPYGEARTVDRKEQGDMDFGSFRFFIAAHGPDETGNPNSVEQDYERMEAFNRGEWTMLGIYAEATVEVGGTLQTVRSGGIYGVESDANTEHLEELAREQVAELRGTLTELGVNVPERIKAAWGNSAPLTGTVAVVGH